ncbi:MAG: TIGR04084 family radical SAM/SPASM domain-containing protein [Candidatus Methanomethylicaceae archaeon]
MLFFVLTTGKCNLNCKYCGGSFPEDRVPVKPTYSMSLLKDFIENDNEPIIAFYGGEPLIQADVIRHVMDNIEARFVIQTNGTLWHALEWDYWKRMDAVLLSIDGTEKTTDGYRGQGTYSKVIQAAKALRKYGYQGDLIARMAVSERTDIYVDVLHLVNLSLFNHIHWQLDVGWSDNWTNFDEWCSANYEPGIDRLVNLWVEELRQGKVLGLVPFLGILKRLREGGRNPPCEAGVNAVAILPNGEIMACPIAYDVEWAHLGKLGQTGFAEMRHKMLSCGISGECLVCAYLKGCGGRCLYMNRERYWGEQGFKKICAVTQHTIDAINAVKDEVYAVLKSVGIDHEVLDYPKFNNSTEIVP